MRKTLSIMLVSLLAIFAFMSTDVKANDMVDYLVEKKIVEGDGSGDLKLDSPIDRASFAKIVVYAIDQVELAEKLKPAAPIFKDMKAGGWANGFANVAATKEIVNGYPGNLFAPNDFVTYEQAIKMLAVVANGADLPKVEKAPGQTWATPYIEKASELGILKHLNVTDYKANAKREDVFNMLYEVLQLKNPTPQALNIRAIVSELTDEGAKLHILNAGDAKDLKVGDEVAFKFAKEINPANYLGKAIDFKFENNVVSEVKVAKEYETLTGSFTIGKDGSLYMNGEKRGYVIDEKENAEDKLLNIVYNGKNYSLANFRADANDKADFGQVTVHNSKVVFINAFNFKEAAPVVDFKGRDIYVVRDENPNQRKKLNLSEIWVYDRNELTKGTDTSISIDDVLHFYDNDKVVVTKKTLRDVEFRIQNGIIMVDGREFPLADKDGFRAVLNLQDNTYDTVVPTKINSMPTLLSMAGQKNTIAVDIFGNVQLIRGDLSQKEEFMIVDALTASEVRLKDMTNRTIEVKDSLGMSIKDGNRVIKLSDLNVNDLVYVFSDKDGVKKIAKVSTLGESAKVDKAGDNFKIDLAPSRGRFALINVDGKTYELSKDSFVLIKSGNTYKFTDLDFVSKYANKDKDLMASIVTTANFEAANTGVKLPLSARNDLIYAILFDNFEETQTVKEEVVVKMTNGFDQKLDKAIIAEDINGNAVSYEIFKNANIEMLNPNDIVKLSLGEDGKVVKAEKAITPDMRVYLIKSVSEKDGITTVEFTREETNEDFTKVLARDAKVFGRLEEGAKMRMMVVNDDIAVLEIVK